MRGGKKKENRGTVWELGVAVEMGFGLCACVCVSKLAQKGDVYISMNVDSMCLSLLFCVFVFVCPQICFRV